MRGEEKLYVSDTIPDIFMCRKIWGKEEADEDKNYNTTHINKTIYSQAYFLEDNRLLEWEAV